MLGRTSNYSLLTQVEDQQAVNYAAPPRSDSSYSERNLHRGGASDQHSFGQSSLTGDWYAPSVSAVASGLGGLGYGQESGGGPVDTWISVSEGGFGVADGGWLSSAKSWAQQMEESYQLQMALALRLSLEATCADDPNFLDLDESASRPSYLSSADFVSHRFWGVRADGNANLSDEIGKQLSLRSSAAGLRPIGAVIYMQRNNLKMCLRSMDSSTDTSEIAKAYGGGGCPSSSSFIIRMDEYSQWLSVNASC